MPSPRYREFLFPAKVYPRGRNNIQSTVEQERIAHDFADDSKINGSEFNNMFSDKRGIHAGGKCCRKDYGKIELLFNTCFCQAGTILEL